MNNGTSIMMRERKRNSNIPFLVSILFMPMMLGGYAYSFGIYANDLKSSLKLTQAELTTLSSAIFLAGVFKWAPGMFIDRYGERISILAGAAGATVCLVLYWCIARRFLLVPPTLVVPVLSSLGLMIFTLQSLITGSVFKGIVSVCGQGSKGPIVGIAKGYIGLGAGAYAVMFKSLKRESNLDLLLMSAVFFLIFGLFLPYFMIPKHDNNNTNYNDNDKSEERQHHFHHNNNDDLTPLHFRVLYGGQMSMAVLVAGESIFTLIYGKHHRTVAFLLAVTGADNDNNNNNNNNNDQHHIDAPPNYLRFVSIFLLWTGPILALLFLPRRERIGLPTIHEEQEIDKLVSSDTSTTTTTTTTTTNDADHDHTNNTMKPRSFTLFQLLKTGPAWLILWTFSVFAGGGVYITQNLGQMVLSLQFDESVVPSAVALFSVASMLARLITGALADHVVGRGFPRPILITLGSLVTALSHALLAVASEQATFIAGVAMSGFSYGMMWPLIVLIVGDIYGKKYLAGNFLFFEGLTIATGTLVLSKFVSQTIYQTHLQDGSTTCLGQSCFQMTHWIATALAATTLLTSFGILNSKLTRQAYAYKLVHEH